MVKNHDKLSISRIMLTADYNVICDKAFWLSNSLFTIVVFLIHDHHEMPTKNFTKWDSFEKNLDQMFAVCYF